MNINNSVHLNAKWIACLCVLTSLSASAKDVQDDIYTSDNELERISVEWVKPASFTDVGQPNASREKFRKHVFSELEKHLDELAKDLPVGQTLKLSVTDVDLAGRVEPASYLGFSHRMDDVRVMRNVDIPRIAFSYQLSDMSGKVIKSDDVKLKNMNYIQSIGRFNRNSPFEHEKDMLSKWFSKNLTNEDA